MGRTKFQAWILIASEPWLDPQYFNDGEIGALLRMNAECALEKSLTPPILEKRCYAS